MFRSCLKLTGGLDLLAQPAAIADLEVSVVGSRTGFRQRHVCFRNCLLETAALGYWLSRRFAQRCPFQPHCGIH